MNRTAVTLALVGLFCGVALARVARSGSVLHAVERERPERMFAARFSVDVAYHHCTRVSLPADSTVPRETCGRNGDVPSSLHRLANAGESLDPGTLQASALVSVLWWKGDVVALGKAIDRLEEALRLSGNRVPLLVDLSGLYLVRGDRTGSAWDLLVALNYAREALSLDADNPAALFNAALASQGWALDDQALQLWTAYLAIDSSSPWAEEARRRRDEIPAPLEAPPAPTPSSSPAQVDSFAAENPQKTREFGWDAVLGQWGEAELTHRAARADSLLKLARQLGHALKRTGGDPSLIEAVRAIDQSRGNSAALQRLAEAHRLYAWAQENFWEKPAEVERAFAQVREWANASPALLAWAGVGTAAVMQVGGKKEPVITLVTGLLSQLDTVQYPAIAARAKWIRGHTHSSNGAVASAITDFEGAAQIYERLREVENWAHTHRTANQLRAGQGDVLSGYQGVHKGAHALRAMRGSVRRHAALLDLSMYAAQDGMPWAALAIQNEDVAAASRAENKGELAEALLTRAQLQEIVDQSEPGTEDLESAATLVSGMDSSRVVDFEHRLNVLRAARAGAAGSGIDSAISFFANRRAAWRSLALVSRTDLRLANGDYSGAITDLDSLTSQTLRISKREPEFRLRSAILDKARTRFDQLVMLHAREGRVREALQALERGRISFASAERAEPVRGTSLPVPVGYNAVEYALIEDTLLTWVVRPDSTYLWRRTIDSEALRLAINLARASLESRERAGPALPQLERLYDWLIRPIEGALDDGETPLVIVADGEIAGVPFAALRDARDERYLIQDRPIRFAASLADAARPSLPPLARDATALLVADPAFDPTRHLDLDPLTGARAERDSIRPMYPRADTLSGARATAGALRTHAPRASVIHYAGHAVFDDTRPERSFLALAGGDFWADSVRSLGLRDGTLVVLSACSTLRGRQGRSGGFAGFSGALLDAGAGGVVGSLWKVNDALAQPLMAEFHRELREHGRTPAEALRQAQIRMLTHGDDDEKSPAAWAGFRYMGR